MSGAMTFRCECRLCNDVFFGSTKETPYCNRCAKRIGYRPPRPESRPRPAVEAAPSSSIPSAVEPAPAAVRAADSTAPTARSAGSPPFNAAPAGTQRPSTAPSPVISPSRSPQAGNPGIPSPTRDIAAARTMGSPGAPKITRSATGTASKATGTGIKETSSNRRVSRGGDTASKKGAPVGLMESTPAPVKITDSLRRSVEHAYEYYAGEPGSILKEIMDKICLEFGLDRHTVHEITSRLHGEYQRQQAAQLTPDQKREVTDRYEKLLTTGARPVGGRRRQIARELGIPLNAVVMAVAGWRTHHHDPRNLSRTDKFRIEKSYWRNIHEECADGETPRSLAAVVARIADETSLPEDGVNFWLDQLHDDTRPMDHLAPLDETVEAGIEQAYRDYLNADAPPADSLHRSLAERFGCSIRQAHRAVMLYRWRERTQRIRSSAEELRMVEQSARASRGETGLNPGENGKHESGPKGSGTG